MRPIWIEIESLVLDGVPLDPARGRRLSALTQAALERLLRLRGIAGPDPAPNSARAQPPATPSNVEMAAGADETWWAEMIARELHRTLDRMG
ncbi:MAG TPA: hypothetical protein VGR45_05015 [Stellaceae bacterium]|nr:hypothetical protein [Stellaceae bacterium]